MTETIGIHGYDYGKTPRSPVTMKEFEELKAAAGWTAADEQVLRRTRELLEDEAEALVDGWREIIGGQPHLAHWFTHPDGSPNDEYKAAVKRRFVQWVRDTLSRPFDQAWLNYQEEIGRRHTPAGKNKTDGSDTPPLVPLQFLIAFMPPTLFAVPERLRNKDLPPDECERIACAWTKVVALTITLWSRPYVQEGLW